MFQTLSFLRRRVEACGCARDDDGDMVVSVTALGRQRRCIVIVDIAVVSSMAQWAIVDVAILSGAVMRVVVVRSLMTLDCVVTSTRAVARIVAVI